MSDSASENTAEVLPEPQPATGTVYLVGGAVRDRLLGKSVHDRDWVVVGTTVDSMLEAGFQQVGRDFPVFLHPQTHEEYALARTERKRGQGHTGFVVHAAQDVTLDEDLVRRDLTINAMAQTPSGQLIDPFAGRTDLQRRILRHVSQAFAEDPLRVLRVARFAAQLPGFEVAPETADLMQEMCREGELRSLSAERVWAETVKALAAPAAGRYWQVLAACGGLEDWFVELKDLTFSSAAEDPVAADIGFARLPLPLDTLRPLAKRLKTPTLTLQLASDVRLFGELLEDWRNAPLPQLCDALAALKANHDDERLHRLLSVWPGRINAAEIQQLTATFRAVPLPDVAPGPELGAALRAARIEALRDLQAGAM